MRFVFLATLAAACLAVSHDAAAIPTYQITDIGPAGSASVEPYAINDSGLIVGAAVFTPGGPRHAFLFDGSTYQDLGTFGGSESFATGINDAGQISGIAVDRSGEDRAFRYSGGIMSDLGTLGGTYAYATGINAAGDVVGVSQTSKEAHATLWRVGEAPLDLGAIPDGPTSLGLGINNKDQVAGGTANSVAIAFLWDAGHLNDLGTLPGSTGARAYSVNDSGQVAGFAYFRYATNRVFVYDHGALTDVGNLGGDAEPTHINARGQVVGYSELGPDKMVGPYHAFLYDNGSMLDLNSVVPSSAGWTLLTANWITDDGRIVGAGLRPDGTVRGFLLTPVPEPASLTLVVAGLLAVAARPLSSRLLSEQ